MSEVAVVVVNFASHRLLRSNLGSTALPPGVRVVVVDNFSTAAERSAVSALCAEHSWELVARDDNAGFGPAVNAGVDRAAAAGAVGVVLLNPDARASTAVLAELRAGLLREPEVASCPRIVTSGGRVEYRGAQVELRTGRIRSISTTFGDDGAAHRIDGQVPGRLRGEVQGWLTGSCLAVGLDLWRRAGGMADDYFLYWEDVDLSLRLERAGGRLVVRHDLTVVHDEGGTQAVATNGQVRADTYYFWNCRNRLAFAAHNLSRRRALGWLLRTPLESGQILIRSERRQLLHATGPLRATVAGSLAGARLVLRSLVRPHPAPGVRSPVLVVHPGAELYGSDRMLLETVDALLRHRPVTVAVPGPGPLVAELRRRGASVSFCRMPVVRKSVLRPAGLRAFVADGLAGLGPAVRLIRRSGTGGVYVNTLTIPSWLVLARLLRRRVVCHVHEAERSASPVLRRLLALPVLCADEVLVNSRFSLDVLLEAVPRLRARARVVYNGVAAPLEPVPARSALTGPLRLLFVGRLSPRKGPDVAVRAVQQLVADGRDVRLDVLGDVFTGYEWFAEELRAAAAALPGRIRFLGFEADVWPRVAEADVVLVPSVVDEPFGNTAVEAVLAGRPAVVSATSGLREAADGFDSVVMVEPGEPAALAGAIALIMDSWPDFATRAADCAVRAAARFGPDRYRAEVAAVVLGGSG